jgi:hypothetical protein
MKENALQVLLVEDSAGEARLLHGNEDAIKREPNESMETYLEQVAVEVQELMNEETLRRIGRDGQ